MGTETDITPAFPTVEALDRFVKAVMVKDRYGYREALVGAYAVPDRTRVLVIDTAGPGKRQVRILEGRYTGSAGFVLAEWIRKR